MQTSYDPWLEVIRDTHPSINVGIPKKELSAGFFRHRSTGMPVGVWVHNNDSLVYKVGNEPMKYVTEKWEENFFSYCDAVLESDYREAIAKGVWRDHIRVGSNTPPQVENLSMEMENLLEIADGMIRKGPAKTEEEARAVAHVKTRLKEVRDLLEAARAAETAPIFRDINEIESRARPLRDKVEEIIRTYEWKKTKILNTINRLVEEVAQPFLLRKREQQVAGGEIQNLRGGGTKPAPTNVGSTGAKITLKTSWHAKIVDYDKAIMALKENAKMKALVQQLADAAARSTARVPVDGVEFYKQEKAQ